MSVIVKEEGGTYEAPPLGLQPAVCVNVLDVGYHKNNFDKLQHKVVVLWELEARKSDGSRFTMGKTYTASLNEKANLRKDLKSWRTRDFTPAELEGFDLEAVIGANCQLNLISADRNGKTYTNIDSVMPKAKGQELRPETPRGSIPEWVQKMMNEALPPPAEGHAPAAPGGEEFTDDIPF